MCFVSACRQPECGEMAECDQCHEWFHKKCESIPDMVSLATQSNMVLRAVNAVLTRTLRLYDDDLNSFLALNVFLHTRYN